MQIGSMPPLHHAPRKEGDPRIPILQARPSSVKDFSHTLRTDGFVYPESDWLHTPYDFTEGAQTAFRLYGKRERSAIGEILLSGVEDRVQALAAGLD